MDKKKKRFFPKVSIKKLKDLHKAERNTNTKIHFLCILKRKYWKSLSDIAYKIEQEKNNIAQLL